MAASLAAEPATARLLLADDQPHILTALELLLGREGYETDFALNPEAVLLALRSQTFDMVLMDLNYTRDTTGGAEGLELVTQIRALDQTLPVVVMTAWGNVELAVEAMRRGASDFVQKPWNNRQMLDKIRTQVEQGRALRSSQRRKDEESAEASEIQRNLLPNSLPQIPGYDLSAVSEPVHFVGGDYYNIVPLTETQTAFCIADVAGKGLPGALLMSNLQASLRPLLRAEVSPRELCGRVNRVLCEIMPENKFISLFYGVLDGRSHRLTYCNAGHNPPIVLRADGSACELNSSGAILGRFPQWQYGQAELTLNQGDTLLLFTDGVVEASDAQNVQFGEQRLTQLGLESANLDATAMQSALLQAVSDHCGGKFQDDATMIVLRRLS